MAETKSRRHAALHVIKSRLRRKISDSHINLYATSCWQTTDTPIILLTLPVHFNWI